MIELDIPGRGTYEIKHLVLDLNGTLALDGNIIDGVAERLRLLGDQVSICIVTADMYSCASKLQEELQIRVHKIEKGQEAAQKLALVEQMGKESTIAIGNGANDVSMLRESALGICVLGKEGAATQALMASSIVVDDIRVALELLCKPKRLIATLRK